MSRIKKKNNNNCEISFVSTKVWACKCLLLTGKLKVVSHSNYQKPNCLCTFPSGGDQQILQKITNAAGARIKWK